MRRLYIQLLRLYPRGFRAQFADEMLAVYDEAIANAAHPTQVALREAVDLPACALREHIAHHMEAQTMQQFIDKHPLVLPITRVGARVISIVTLLTTALGVFLTLQINQEAGLGTAWPLVIVMSALIAAYFAAWRYEQTGGLVAIAASVGIIGVALGQGLGMALGLAAPFAFTGLLFYAVGRYT